MFIISFRTNKLSRFFKKRKISHPRYPTHLYHVSIGETGELLGLPKEWTLEAPHAFRIHPITRINPQTQSPEQQNPPPPEPLPPPIPRSPPLPQPPLIHPRSILERIGKSSSAPVSTVKSHHALSQQKEKDKNVFSEWIDKAVSNNHLKLHKYQLFGDFKEIGSGSFGTVYCAYNIQYAKYMVLKSLNINNKFTTEQMLKQIVNELQQHRQVEMHDNVIGFYGVTKNVLGEYMLVMEYANDGTLRQYLSKNFSKMDWNIKLKFAKQISSAIHCLHSNNIIHRDLHSNNIFIHSNDIKLGDFGLSKSIAGATTSFSKAFGSVRYSDPEFLKDPDNYKRTEASDVYSVGVLMWEISSGKLPFQSLNSPYNISHKVFNGGRENIIPGTPKIYVDIYTACWQANPTKRPKMSQVVKLLDKVDINDPIQVVDDVPSSDLTTDINDPSSSNDTENQFFGSKTDLFEITSTMERRLYEE